MQLSKLSISVALVCAAGAMAAPDNGDDGELNFIRIGHGAPAPDAAHNSDESSKEHEMSSMDHEESSKDEAAEDGSSSKTDTTTTDGASGLMSSFVGLAIAGGVSVLVSAF